VDLSGRPYVVHEEPDGMAPLIGAYDTTLTRHIFESLAASAGVCLHVRVLSGRNPHHIVEAQFKAVARALRTAVSPDPRSGGVPSTKGVL
jgi:imidazoleglycerol-phosphate dehydratase